MRRLASIFVILSFLFASGLAGIYDILFANEVANIIVFVFTWPIVYFFGVDYFVDYWLKYRR